MSSVIIDLETKKSLLKIINAFHSNYDNFNAMTATLAVFMNRKVATQDARSAAQSSSEDPRAIARLTGLLLVRHC